MDTERLIELETKMAYQEDTIQQLNDVVCRQQNQIDELLEKCNFLLSRTKELSDKQPDGAANIEKPPHY
ncbi:MAG: SlyX family protein [Porticoccus sp.]|nr:SlyX family protein [Porticoccus sp.]